MATKYSWLLFSLVIFIQRQWIFLHQLLDSLTQTTSNDSYDEPTREAWWKSVEITASRKNGGKDEGDKDAHVDFVRARVPSSIANDIVKDEYLSWLFNQRNASLHEEPLVIYSAGCGLGHQLERLSAAYHLLMIYEIPHLQLHNRKCGLNEIGGETLIYDHLLGPGHLIVDVPAKFAPSDRNHLVRPHFWPEIKMANKTNNTTVHKRQIQIENEVPGYAKAKVQRHGKSRKRLFFNKDVSDFQMYQQMFLLFEQKHWQRIRTILDKTRFEQHTVYALHVRAGNGEVDDFEKKNRGFVDIDQWISSFMKLFCDFTKQNDYMFQGKPPMLFVGTDTVSVIPKLRKASYCNIPIVTTDQEFLEEGEAVTWNHKFNDRESCLKGWEDQFLDMYFFTQAHSMLTASYSSFPQAAPLSFAMHKAKTLPNNHHYYCEIGHRGDRMDCYDAYRQWYDHEPSLTFGNTTSEMQVRGKGVKHPIPTEDFNGLFEGTVMEVIKPKLRTR